MIKIYAMDVSNLSDPKDYPDLLDGLTEKRKEKTLRYRKEKDRKQSLGAGILLKQCLDEIGKRIEDIRYGANGKPEIEGIFFNLSHSHNMVICAVSEKQIGCDIEWIDELKEGIAKRFLSESEIKYLNRFKGKEKRDEFYRIWTMKESYMKMTGEGMSLSLNRFEFLFEEEIKVFRDGAICSCKIKEYQIPGYKLTVCAEEDDFPDNVIYVKKEGGFK